MHSSMYNIRPFNWRSSLDGSTRDCILHSALSLYLHSLETTNILAAINHEQEIADSRLANFTTVPHALCISIPCTVYNDHVVGAVTSLTWDFILPELSLSFDLLGTVVNSSFQNFYLHLECYSCRSFNLNCEISWLLHLQLLPHSSLLI